MLAPSPLAGWKYPFTPNRDRLRDYAAWKDRVPIKLEPMKDVSVETEQYVKALVLVDEPEPQVQRKAAVDRTVLCSRTPGRERWQIEALEDRPRLAAALELLLGSEAGVQRVQANPLTGRVLVHYRPEAISASIEALIRRALEFGPMTPEEYAARPKTSGGWSAAHLLVAEIACTALKLTLFGGCCSLGLGAAGLLFLHHRRRLKPADSRTERTPCCSDCT
jgi:hypothetical protein